MTRRCKKCKRFVSKFTSLCDRCKPPRKTFYAIISQHNWSKKCMSANGREYTAITQYIPTSVDEARYLDSIGMLKLVEAPDDSEENRPGCPWGHGVYKFEVNYSKPVLVKADWDTSG